MRHFFDRCRRGHVTFGSFLSRKASARSKDLATVRV